MGIKKWIKDIFKSNGDKNEFNYRRGRSKEYDAKKKQGNNDLTEKQQDKLQQKIFEAKTDQNIALAKLKNSNQNPIKPVTTNNQIAVNSHNTGIKIDNPTVAYKQVNKPVKKDKRHKPKKK